MITEEYQDEYQEHEEQEQYEHHRFEVDPGQSLTRIDKYLDDRITNASRTKIQAAATAGNIVVNNKAVKSNYKVKPGDTIQVMMSYPPRDIEIIPENIPLTIVFEDEYLLIVNKPPGMVVHPSYGHYSGTLINALAYYLKDLDIFSNSDDPRPGLVHRIDKNTSGLLLIAKTEQAKMVLSKQFADHTTRRTYNAMVWGNFAEEHGTIVGNVGRNLKDRKVMDVFEDEEIGKHAVTHYSVLENFGYVSLVECRLETGRTHQIRVHMQHIKHPLFNDAEYGGDLILKGTTFTKYKQYINNCFEICPRQALHAKTLGFEHPITGESMDFDSDWPDDFKNLVEKWRGYVSNRELEE
ncbi:MAG: RluA family pseudouridine synthase [Salinivirgaceae bacterium]|nr:RluA family pseudouridine synthase [Salinivirgaceae bacterium]